MSSASNASVMVNPIFSHILCSYTKVVCVYEASGVLIYRRVICIETRDVMFNTLLENRLDFIYGL